MFFRYILSCFHDLTRPFSNSTYSNQKIYRISFDVDDLDFKGFIKVLRVLSSFSDLESLIFEFYTSKLVYMFGLWNLALEGGSFPPQFYTPESAFYPYLSASWIYLSLCIRARTSIFRLTDLFSSVA